MFGFKSRRSRSGTRRTGSPLSGIFNLFSRRRARSGTRRRAGTTRRGGLIGGLRRMLRSK